MIMNYNNRKYQTEKQNTPKRTEVNQIGTQDNKLK